LARVLEASPGGLRTLAEFSVAEAALCAEDEQTLERAEEAFLTAAKCYEEARRGGERVAGALEVLTFNIGMFYETALGDGQKALQWYGKNLALQAELPLSEAEKNANRALAEAQMGLAAAELLRDLDQAQQYAAAAQESLGRMGEAEQVDPDLLARIHLGIGALLSRLPDGVELAVEQFRAALQSLERTERQSPRIQAFEFAAHRELAKQLELLGQEDEAGAHLTKSLELARELRLGDSAADEPRPARVAGQPASGAKRQ